MNTINQKHFRLLAIAPSTGGVGFAVLEGPETLVDSGVKRVKGDNKNAQSLKKVEELIAHYQPGTLVLEDAAAKGSRRSPRIRRLCQQIIKMAESHKVNVKLYSRDQVMKTFFPDRQGTKYALAEIVAQRFFEQLGFQLPPKRKTWESEPRPMALFDAVAVVLMPRLTARKDGHPNYA